MHVKTIYRMYVLLLGVNTHTHTHRFTQSPMLVWLMVMIMTWHLAGHTHRWWTPSDFAGSLQRVRLGAEARYPSRVLESSQGGKGGGTGPHRLTEQMLSPPPAPVAKKTHDGPKENFRDKLVWVWTWVTADVDYTALWLCESDGGGYLDSAALNSGSQFSSARSQQGSFRLAGAHRPILLLSPSYYRLMHQNKSNKYVHGISPKWTVPAFPDSTPQRWCLKCECLLETQGVQ